MKVEITSDELRESLRKAKAALKPEKKYSFWTHLIDIVYLIVNPRRADQQKCERALSELIVDTEKAVGTIKYLEQTIVNQDKINAEQKQINAEKDKQIKQLEQKAVDGAIKSEYDKQQQELINAGLHKMIREMQEQIAKSKLEQTQSSLEQKLL